VNYVSSSWLPGKEVELTLGGREDEVADDMEKGEERMRAEKSA